MQGRVRQARDEGASVRRWVFARMRREGGGGGEGKERMVGCAKGGWGLQYSII